MTHHLPPHMHRRQTLLALAAMLTLGTGTACTAASAGGRAAAAPAAATTLDIMTFNLRYASDRQPNAWPARRPVMRELIAAQNPDVFGTQEGVYAQLQDMAADLPAYRWIGLGREGGSRGEFMAVFYKPERLEPLEFDHFWLSDTPMVMASKGWGNNITRMVTWVRFRDRRSGTEFVFVNTHFDHQSQQAREKSAELLAERAKAWGPEVPVVLVGDFNADAGANRAYDILTGAGGFADSWRTLGLPETMGSFHDFKGEAEARTRKRIDWILTRGPVTPEASQIVTFQRGGQYPSDHFPVTARLRVGSR